MTTRGELIQFLRRHVQDNSQANALYENQELTDEVIGQCIDMTLSDFNFHPPVTSFTVSDMPMAIIVWGSIIEMLIAAGILNSRNRLIYQAGSVQVQVSDKAGEYANWINLLLNKYESSKTKYKYALNLEGCYGGLPSEYSLANIGLDYNLGQINSLTLDSIL